MAEINYFKGDATHPTGDDNKIITHICNDIGGWGKGFVLAISKRWKSPEMQYRQWHKDNSFTVGKFSVPFELGQTQFVQVEIEPVVKIANMIAQHGIRKSNNVAPIRYESLRECLRSVCVEARALQASVHMPYIGCGLAGGKWEMIEPIIREELTSQGVDVYVYEFA